MRLDDYFEFLSPLDIRVRGTQVGIETILHDYLNDDLFAEDIAARYPTLTLEQVYATLTYYWHDREQVEDYLLRADEAITQQRREQDEHPSPAVLRLRSLVNAMSAGIRPLHYKDTFSRLPLSSSHSA